MRVGAILSAALLAAGCDPKVIDYRVRIITAACQGDPNPMERVTHFRVRVSGEGIATPLESVSPTSVAEQVIKIPEIPVGKGRVIEVRAYEGTPGADGKVVSWGRSTPFDIPDYITDKQKDLPEINVFLRRVNEFVHPNNPLALNSCGKMALARAGHTATLLPSGKVYIAGGFQQSGTARTTLYKAELFNPATGAFEEAPDIGLINSQSMFAPLPRAFHTATVLKNGQVLVWGGEYVSGAKTFYAASVLVYDPPQNSYGGVPSINLSGISRSHHAAVLDANGKVLVVGGMTWVNGNPAVADKVEWYDPATTVSKVIDGVTLPRTEMGVAALQGGRYVAVAGGSDGTTLKDEVAFFEFDQGAGAFRLVRTSAPRLRASRRAAGVAPFRDGNDLILVGGYTAAGAVASSEIVSTKDQFNVADGPNVSPRGDICAAALPDGRVLILGGRTQEGAQGKSAAEVEMLIPQASGSATVLGKTSLPVSRYWHTCTPLQDGTVLVLGGVKESGTSLEVLQDALLYTPEPLDP